MYNHFGRRIFWRKERKRGARSALCLPPQGTRRFNQRRAEFDYRLPLPETTFEVALYPPIRSTTARPSNQMHVMDRDDQGLTCMQEKPLNPADFLFGENPQSFLGLEAVHGTKDVKL